MSLSDRLFPKKSKSLPAELAAKETGYFGNAEQLANVVVTGLEKENYSEMSQQLASMVPVEQERVEYVFDVPDLAGTFIGMTVCVATAFIFLYFLFIGSATAVLSTDLSPVGVVIGGISLVILSVNVYLATRLLFAAKRKVRFDLYAELLGFKSLEFVEDLALCSKQKEPTVINDLRWAVQKKLIPQGHFSDDNLVFMVSDRVYNQYMEKAEVYNRYFRKKLEERHRVKSRTKFINQIMENGEQYIKKLNGFKIIVKDKTVSRKIERLSNVVSMIFHEIDANPSQAHSMGVFLNYYLPTTERLLDAYISIAEKKDAASNLITAKKEIEESLNTIIRSFEGILEKLYEEYEMDIASDISAMETVMKQEGLPG